MTWRARKSSSEAIKRWWMPELKVLARIWTQVCLTPKIKCYFSIQHYLKRWMTEFLCTSFPHTNAGSTASRNTSSFTLKQKGKGHLLINPCIHKCNSLWKRNPQNTSCHLSGLAVFIKSKEKQEVCILHCSSNILLYYYYKSACIVYTSGIETFFSDLGAFCFFSFFN